MKSKFKFFRGYVGTINIIEGETYATASLNTTLYHPGTFQPYTEEETQRWLATNELNLIQLEIQRDQQGMTRERIENNLNHIENELRLFQATTTITVKPSLWTKLKIFGTRVKLVFKEIWRYEPIGLVYVSFLTLLLSIIGILTFIGVK